MDLSKKVIVIVCLVIAVLCGGIIAATLFSEPESIDEVNITNNNTTETDNEVAESSDGANRNIIRILCSLWKSPFS